MLTAIYAIRLGEIHLKMPIDHKDSTKGIPSRGWSKRSGVWVFDAIWLEEIRIWLSLDRVRLMPGNPFTRNTPPPPKRLIAGNLAIQLADRLAGELKEGVYRAQVRVLHPDTGGDGRLMQECNHPSRGGKR